MYRCVLNSSKGGVSYMYSSALWNHILDGIFHVIFLSLEVLSNLYMDNVYI